MKIHIFVALAMVMQYTILALEYPELELQNKIFKGYNSNVRPVKNCSKPVVVTVGLALRKVLYLDEMRQSFKSTMNINLYWHDESLQWNKSEFHGIKNVEIPYNKNIWIPDLMVLNALDRPENLGVQDAFIRLNDIGQVYVWTQTNLETACGIRTKKYPYDLQVCDIVITKFMSSDAKIEIRPLEKHVYMDDYVEIAEWKIEDTSVGTTVIPFNITLSAEADFPLFDIVNYTSITYTLTLKRSCKLCFFNIILPVLILGVLNFLTFFVPCESGEKLSNPIAMFLTLAVFLTTITRSLPESIDGASYLSLYVTFQLAVSAMILLCAVTSLHIHHKKRKSYIHYIVCQITKCFRRKQTQMKGCKNMNSSYEDNYIENGRSKTLSERYENFHSDGLSKAFDMLMFYVFGLCEVIATITFSIFIWN
ncbi:acetylcholine receptor subunit alpha-1-A-like [Ruditapes philippinarum]|uniref:acetylcholine receptor subunit alpha-1-A-like n=1 Tax=Ruditapes philippinarum TaxID=129788 RepID=UPI00295AABA4|nr:acetylcholine receptor subunit alpha-1-A-like [Ruditapes philippinarum]